MQNSNSSSEINWNFKETHLLVSRDSLESARCLTRTVVKLPGMRLIDVEASTSKEKESLIDTLLEIDELLEDRLNDYENDNDNDYVVTVFSPLELFGDEENEDFNYEVLGILQNFIEYGKELGIHVAILEIPEDEVQENECLSALAEDLSRPWFQKI